MYIKQNKTRKKKGRSQLAEYMLCFHGLVFKIILQGEEKKKKIFFVFFLTNFIQKKNGEWIVVVMP